MDPTLKIAADQLGRMRGMTRYYHERFFSDIRLQVVLTVALFVVGFWQVEGAFPPDPGCRALRGGPDRL